MSAVSYDIRHFSNLCACSFSESGIMQHHKIAVSSEEMFTFNSATPAAIASATILLAFIFSKVF